MITQLTNNKTILKEFYFDIDRALYWHRKQHGSASKYERKLDEMANLAGVQHEDQVGNIIDYTSSNGNKWKIFDVCERVDGEIRFTTKAFLYWDTIGSVGAVVPSIDHNGKKGVVIFTSHFFLRVAERRSTIADTFLVCAFMTQNNSIKIQPGKDEKGKDCIDILVKEGVCKGYIREYDENGRGDIGNAVVIEARTFLMDKQLKPKEQKRNKQARDLDSDEIVCREMLTQSSETEKTRDAFERCMRHEGFPKGYGAFVVDFLRVILMLGLSDEQKEKYGKESPLSLISDEAKRELHRHMSKAFVKGTLPMSELYNLCLLFIPDNKPEEIQRNFVLYSPIREIYSEEELTKVVAEYQAENHPFTTMGQFMFEIKQRLKNDNTND